MKILHILNTDRFSGAENVVCQIVSMFRDMPEVEMIYCSRDGQIREALKERNVSFAPVSEVSVSEIKRVIKEEKPDIVHAHDMKASFVAARACKNIPLISHVHNNNFNSRGFSAKSVAYLIAAIKAKHIFWVSESSYTGYFFHKLLKKKSSVLYNIINISELYEKMAKDENEYNYDVIYLGRLTYPKNPQRLMHVFEKLKKKKPDMKAAVVGIGELEDEVKALATKLGIEENVTFLGFQSNPLKILKDSKAMLMTSRWEGTPMCALEAMTLGVPIVTTPTDGLSVVVRNGETGFLSDDDDVLTEKLFELIENTELQKRMSDETLKKAYEINDVEKYKRVISEQYKKGVGII